MRVLLLPLLLLSPLAAARLLHSIPEDTHAFPKFRVAFLNALPLAKETAHRWHAHGLLGGLPQFLDQPWNEQPPREIEDAASLSALQSVPAATPNYTLEYMKMGPKDSYLCLIPKPLERTAPPPEEDLSKIEATPSRSWSLLQPLAGSCLYHKQGWFTYSYCHNDQIRQFKEAAQTPNPTGGYRPPEEDTEWEAYTLGKAPKPGADLSVTEQNGQPANIELAHGAGSRYLVQRWGDGTLCDKTGRHREIEVQFHCSMTMTDTILFVKETKTCSYVLVINTPRLCGEPGFKSLRDKGEESEIQCREVVDAPSTLVPKTGSNLPNADFPVKVPRKRPVLPSPVKETKPKKENNGDVLRKTMETILKQPGMTVEDLSEGDDLVFEMVDVADITEETLDRVAELLRNAGIDVKAEKIVVGGDKKDKDQGKKKPSHKRAAIRDEL